MSIEGHGHLHMKVKLAFLRNHWAILTKFCMQAFMNMKRKICLYNANHLTKMAVIPIFGKKTHFGIISILHWNQRFDMKHQGLRPNSLFKL